MLNSKLYQLPQSTVPTDLLARIVAVFLPILYKRCLQSGGSCDQSLTKYTHSLTDDLVRDKKRVSSPKSYNNIMEFINFFLDLLNYFYKSNVSHQCILAHLTECYLWYECTI